MMDDATRLGGKLEDIVPQAAKPSAADETLEEWPEMPLHDRIAECRLELKYAYSRIEKLEQALLNVSQPFVARISELERTLRIIKVLADSWDNSWSVDASGGLVELIVCSCKEVLGGPGKT